MRDNAPQGDSGERNEGLEIKSRPRESHSESRGSASHGARGTIQKQVIRRKKGTFPMIFPVLWTLFRGVRIKLSCAVA